MMYNYMTNGTCSRQIYLNIEDGILKDVEFVGGCHGNLQGVCALVKGMKCDDVVAKLEGIKCGFKQTSCPDQLTRAIKEAMAK